MKIYFYYIDADLEGIYIKKENARRDFLKDVKWYIKYNLNNKYWDLQTALSEWHYAKKRTEYRKFRIREGRTDD